MYGGYVHTNKKTIPFAIQDSTSGAVTEETT